jgi:hypothetical protein
LAVLLWVQLPLVRIVMEGWFQMMFNQLVCFVRQAARLGLAFDVIGISYGTQWLWEHTGHVCLKWSDACCCLVDFTGSLTLGTRLLKGHTGQNNV